MIVPTSRRLRSALAENIGKGACSVEIRAARAVALEGATLREDLDDDATLHGKKLENSEIVMKGVRPPKAAATLLELLNRYSAKERKN